MAKVSTSGIYSPNTVSTCPLVSAPVGESVIPGVSLNTDSFQSLKSQVQRLKSEHKQVLGVHKTAKQVFTSHGLLTSCVQYAQCFLHYS